MANTLKVMFQRYLKTHPVMTNSVVYGVLYGSAELTQQTVKQYSSVASIKYDFATVGRLVFIGSSIYAPTLYHWYKYLDHKLPGKTFRVVATKVTADQFLMTPVLLVVFFFACGVLERKQDISEELREKYWRVLCANEIFWIPAQAINFVMMPSHLRVTYVSCMAFIWVNILCYLRKDNVQEKKGN